MRQQLTTVMPSFKTFHRSRDFGKAVIVADAGCRIQHCIAAWDQNKHGVTEESTSSGRGYLKKSAIDINDALRQLWGGAGCG